jgi:protein-tyrosine phosphatase
MGRPGFNRCHWFDLSLEEGVVLSWLGKQQQTALPLVALWNYLDDYGPKVAPFYGLSADEVRVRLQRLRDQVSLTTVLEGIRAKTGVFHELSWCADGGQTGLRVIPNVRRVQHELEVLRRHKVSVIISLLEQPLDQAVLSDSFEVYHFPIEDVAPPSHEQVYAFADLLQTALAARKNVVTHCLAGLGRTTTMLIAAYLVQGYPLHQLVARIQACNPHFLFKGSQVTFLQELADGVASGRLPLLSSGRRTHPCL